MKTNKTPTIEDYEKQVKSAIVEMMKKYKGYPFYLKGQHDLIQEAFEKANSDNQFYLYFSFTKPFFTEEECIEKSVVKKAIKELRKKILDNRDFTLNYISDFEKKLGLSDVTQDVTQVNNKLTAETDKTRAESRKGKDVCARCGKRKVEHYHHFDQLLHGHEGQVFCHSNEKQKFEEKGK